MFQILVRALCLGCCVAVLSACGQQGPLYLPTQAAAASRASLPQSLLPSKTPASQPAKPISSPP
ncbi:MAG TPA: lipoprotein [Rhodoferax sp.]|nr:lipoprotein [Rhodoferax sp.]